MTPRSVASLIFQAAAKRAKTGTNAFKQNNVCGHETPLSLTDDLDQHAFSALSVKLTVEYLLPGSEIQFAVRDGDDDLAAHDLPL